MPASKAEQMLEAIRAPRFERNSIAAEEGPGPGQIILRCGHPRAREQVLASLEDVWSETCCFPECLSFRLSIDRPSRGGSGSAGGGWRAAGKPGAHLVRGMMRMATAHLGDFRATLRQLYFGRTRRALVFQSLMLGLDLLTLAYFLVTTFIHGAAWIRVVDVVLSAAEVPVW